METFGIDLRNEDLWSDEKARLLRKVTSRYRDILEQVNLADTVRNNQSVLSQTLSPEEIQKIKTALPAFEGYLSSLAKFHRQLQTGLENESALPSGNLPFEPLVSQITPITGIIFVNVDGQVLEPSAFRTVVYGSAGSYGARYRGLNGPGTNYTLLDIGFVIDDEYLDNLEVYDGDDLYVSIANRNHQRYTPVTLLSYSTNWRIQRPHNAVIQDLYNRWFREQPVKQNVDLSGTISNKVLARDRLGRRAEFPIGDMIMSYHSHVGDDRVDRSSSDLKVNWTEY